MSLRKKCLTVIASIQMTIILISLPSCGSSNATSPQDANHTGSGQIEESATISENAPVSDELGQTQFEEAELPDAFPSSFPIPEDARISSNVSMGGENEFRVFISLTTTLDEALTYYHSELPDRGWTIVSEQISNRGTEMVISSDEYDGDLLFVTGEMGVAVDTHLYPPGTVEAIPDLPSALGDSGALGENVGSFPADFPVPSSYTQIELNDSLHAEGYELAFTYVGIAEMGMIDFNIALMSAGWEIGDMELEGMSGAYVLPFNNPSSGFEGFAYITSNPGQFDFDTGGAMLIALASGKP